MSEITLTLTWVTVKHSNELIIRKPDMYVIRNILFVNVRSNIEQASRRVSDLIHTHAIYIVAYFVS